MYVHKIVSQPSLIVIVGISYIIELVKDNVWAGYFFRSIRVGVLVLIAKAVFTFFKDIRKNVLSYLLMTASFLLVLLTDVRVIYIILSSMVVAIAALGLRQIYVKKILHAVGTPEYYNERIGRTLEKNEYIRETDFTLSKRDDKAIVSAIDTSNSSFAKTSAVSEEGKRK